VETNKPGAVTKYCPSCGAANTLLPPLPDQVKCFWCDEDFEPAKPTSKPFTLSLKAMERSQRRCPARGSRPSAQR
jgi:hypothetical protein